MSDLHQMTVIFCNFKIVLECNRISFSFSCFNVNANKRYLIISCDKKKLSKVLERIQILECNTVL